jgi:GntR family transcriptional regulator/MocR family aminotransferase
VPVDAEGLRVADLPADARAVVVTPSHQFPLGMPMSLPRRVALLAWAERHDAVVVEDDYDSEFRFGGRPIEPLQHIDRTGRVLYVGSFSKVLSPGLRTGFLVAPAPLHDALRTARFVTDWHGPTLEQAVLARFVDEGLLATHVRRLQRSYAARHEALQSALRQHLGRWLDPVPSVAGLHTSGLTADDPGAAVAGARTARVALRSLAEWSDDPAAPHGISFGFGRATPEQVEAGVTRLAQFASG